MFDETRNSREFEYLLALTAKGTLHLILKKQKMFQLMQQHSVSQLSRQLL